MNRVVNPLHYIMDESVLADSSQLKTDKAKEAFLASMGVTIEDDAISINTNKMLQYMLSAMCIVSDEGENLWIYNQSAGIFEPCRKYNLTVTTRFLLSQVADYSVWSASLDKKLIYEMAGHIDTVISDFDTGRFLTLKNCAYDTVNFKTVDFAPKHLNTKCVDYNYDPNAECPHFMNFIKDITCNNSQLADLIQEVTGYVFANHNKAEKAFIIIGPARNGKSTFASVLRKLVGEINVSATPLKTLGSTFGLEDLLGKRLNVTTESDVGEAVSVTEWKALTSGDPICVNRKGQKQITTALNVKMISFMNHLPQFGESGAAIQRRLILIPFTATIPEDKVDPDLDKKLAKELSGILNWALRGLERLANNNWFFTHVDESDKLLGEFMAQQNPLVEFVEDMIEPSTSKTFVKCKDLHVAFDTWFYENDGERYKITGFNNEVIKAIKAKYSITEGKVGGVRGVYGISIKKYEQRQISDIRKYQRRA